MVFVGDSLNRGQWVSMVCLLGSAVPNSHKSLQSNGSLTAFKVKVRALIKHGILRKSTTYRLVDCVS